jgi:hypothetical protein
MHYNILVAAERANHSVTGNVFKDSARLDDGGAPVTDLALVQDLFDELQEAFIKGAVNHVVLHVERAGNMTTAETILRSSFYMADDCILTMAIVEIEE